MLQGISLHIGLSYVDPNHYEGCEGRFYGRENEVRTMQMLACKQKFATTLLLNEHATAQRCSGCIFLFTKDNRWWLKQNQ